MQPYMNSATSAISYPVISRRLANRVLLVLGILGYVVIFQWVYITWLHYNYDYMGFAYNPPPADYLALSFCLSLLPGFFMPIKLLRPSQLIYWVLYLAVFIPAMFVPLYIALQPASDVAMLMISLFAGFLVTGCSYLFPLLRLRTSRLPKTVFWLGFAFVTLSLTAWVITVFRDHMRLVSLHNIYKEVRFAADEVMVASSVGYAIMWLSSVFNPFLISWGLVHKRLSFLIAGVLGQVLIYSTVGAKSAILSIPILFLFYFVLRKHIDHFGLRLIWGVVAVFLLLNSINMVMGDISSGSLKMLSAIIFMRTFGMPGVLAGQYHAFFQDHPLTYLSHVNVVRLLQDYPYSNPVGIEIGNYFYGVDSQMNANVNFWITDGLAGFGLPGILLISLLCALVFWLLDSTAKGHSPIFTALLVSFAALNISNISLFTTLLSGGLGFCILIFYLMPKDLFKNEMSIK